MSPEPKHPGPIDPTAMEADAIEAARSIGFAGRLLAAMLLTHPEVSEKAPYFVTFEHVGQASLSKVHWIANDEGVSLWVEGPSPT